MSFDLSFLRCSSLQPSDAEVDAVLNHDTAATPEEQAQIRRLAEALVAAYPGASWGISQHGAADGAWVSEGDLPDIDLRARSAFVSAHFDPRDPEALPFFKGLAKLFEQHGYVCFDHQRGALVLADRFTFG